jgi:hypothetical protein
MAVDLSDDELSILLRHARQIIDDMRDAFFTAVADRLRGQHVSTSALHAAIHGAKDQLGIGGQTIAGPPGPKKGYGGARRRLSLASDAETCSHPNCNTFCGSNHRR